MIDHLPHKLVMDEAINPGTKFLLPVIKYLPKCSIIHYSIMKVALKYIEDGFTALFYNCELLAAKQSNVRGPIYLGHSN